MSKFCFGHLTKMKSRPFQLKRYEINNYGGWALNFWIEQDIPSVVVVDVVWPGGWCVMEDG